MIKEMNRFTKAILVPFAALVILITTTSISHAFKIETHIWVGQEVLNDVLDDGKVTIEPYGEFVVDPQIVDSLRKYPDIYLMGNAGPDALPDILAGQMVVHPGIPGDWVTNDWLKWIIGSAGEDQESMAFAYGYISHAGADAFSHTYVNMYTGDFYNLEDGMTEETRHLLLEGYIVDHTPALRNKDGEAIGSYSENIDTADSFISRSLILNETVAERYKKSTSTIHLWSMNSLNNKISNVIKQIDDLNEMLNIMPDGINDLFEGMAEAQQTMFDYQNKIEDFLLKIAALEKSIKAQQDLIDAQIAVINGATNRMVNYSNKIADLNSWILSNQAKLAGMDKQIPKSILGEIFCVRYPCRKGWKIKMCKKCAPKKYTKWVTNPAWAALNSKIGKWISEKATYVEKLAAEKALRASAELTKDHLELAKSQLDFELANLQSALKNYRLLRENIQKDLIALQQPYKHLLDLLTMSDDLRMFLVEWQKDIQGATKAYSHANGKVIKDMVAGAFSLDPLSDWSKQHLAVFAGVPQDVLNIANAMNNHLSNIRALSNYSWVLNPAELVIDEVTKKLEEKAKESGEKIADKISGIEIKELIDALRTHNDGGKKMTDAFSKDDSSKNLLIIPDIKQRIDGDMHLDADGKFDPVQFRPVYNSITLSKLSLLSPSQLNILVDRAREANGSFESETTLYGDTLFPGDSKMNILFDWIKSIDGHFQWQSVAVPLPRKDDNGNPGYADVLESEENSHGLGYDPVRNAGGLRIWQDDNARKYIFNIIFKGPLVEGLEWPLGLELPEVLGAAYPYRACPLNPFPITVDNQGEFITHDGKFGDYFCSINDMLPYDSEDKSDDKGSSGSFGCGESAIASSKNGVGMDGNTYPLLNLISLLLFPMLLIRLMRKLKPE